MNENLRQTIESTEILNGMLQRIREHARQNESHIDWSISKAIPASTDEELAQAMLDLTPWVDQKQIKPLVDWPANYRKWVVEPEITGTVRWIFKNIGQNFQEFVS